jgi:hypothetical protein
VPFLLDVECCCHALSQQCSLLFSCAVMFSFSRIPAILWSVIVGKSFFPPYFFLQLLHLLFFLPFFLSVADFLIHVFSNIHVKVDKFASYITVPLFSKFTGSCRTANFIFFLGGGRKNIGRCHFIGEKNIKKRKMCEKKGKRPIISEQEEV